MDECRVQPEPAKLRQLAGAQQVLDERVELRGRQRAMADVERAPEDVLTAARL